TLHPHADAVAGAASAEAVRQARRQFLAVGVVAEEDDLLSLARLGQRAQALLGLIVVDANGAHRSAELLRRAGQPLRRAIISEQNDRHAHTAAAISWSRCASSSTVRSSHAVSLVGMVSSTTSYQRLAASTPSSASVNVVSGWRCAAITSRTLGMRGTLWS